MVTYVSPIDPHVHLRGTEYKEEGFMQKAFEDARAVGLCAILEQPNPVPNLTTDSAIATRMTEAEKYSGGIYHGIHRGMTTDPNQVIDSLRNLLRMPYRIPSDKVFYVHSTGDMGILDEDFQKGIWEAKANIGYTGVSIGHFEDEKAFGCDFDPSIPVTHSLRQNKNAELIQVERQLRNARDARFEGTFYIAHTSNPETVKFINRERSKTKFPIINEFTFHHIFLNISDYAFLGNFVKMNPPLRMPKVQEELLEMVVSGKVPKEFMVFGTDHAPHTIEKKMSSNPPSGIPAIPFYPKGIQLLREAGIKEDALESALFDNSQRIFGLPIKKVLVDIEYDPSLWEKYGFNPFQRYNVA